MSGCNESMLKCVGVQRNKRDKFASDVPESVDENFARKKSA